MRLMIDDFMPPILLTLSHIWCHTKAYFRFKWDLWIFTEVTCLMIDDFMSPVLLTCYTSDAILGHISVLDEIYGSSQRSLKRPMGFSICLGPPGEIFSIHLLWWGGPLFCHEEAAWTGGQEHDSPMVVGEDDALAEWCTWKQVVAC